MESCIVPVHGDDMIGTGVLWRALLDRGVYTNCSLPPAVPRPMLRTSVMATHTEQQVDRALAAFEEIARDGVVDAGRGALMSVLGWRKEHSQPGGMRLQEDDENSRGW